MSEYILNLLMVNDEEKKEFEAIAPDATHVWAGRKTVTLEQLASATVIMGWPRPEDMKHAVNLRWFQTQWSGTEEYEGPGTLPEGVVFTSSNGANRRGVAEHMLACLLSLCRRLPTYQESQLARRWGSKVAVKTLLDSTVLVLGTGSLGTTFAKMCRGLGSHVIGLKRTVDGPMEGFDEVYQMDRLDELLPQADVVAMVLPHSPATTGLMDAGRIANMKQGAILVNAGRGSVLDHDALIRALESGHLWGAALDVTEPEPLPADSPLWGTPNLLLTPHVAGGMQLELTRRTCIQMAQENLRRYLAGEPMNNVIRGGA